MQVDINRFKNKIITAPAGLLLKFLKDNAVDLALIDPCYGIDYTGQLKRKLGGKGLSISKYHWNDYGASKENWDAERTNPDLIKEVIRVSKNQIVWGGNYFADILPASQGWLVWNKGQRKFSLADGELAWTSYDKALRIFDYSRSQYKADEPNKIHATQKPAKLFKWCIEQAKLKPGAVILDCFAGSCTTAIAAYDLGFDFVCVEQSPEMALKAKARFEKHKSQIRLFTPEEIAIQTSFIQGVQA
jgi:site-specific DNA-methyltransferase (adenine-specific)